MSGPCGVPGDADALARRAAAWLAGVVWSSPRERIALCLPGGSTPRRLLERLVEEALPWERVHWFWGDERCVPPDDPRSNFGAAWRVLLARAPAENAHPVPTVGLTPQDAARRYEAELRALRRGDPCGPLFDAVLLGVGEDGHTASLFPGDPALEERRRWVMPVTGPDGLRRITLTYPALESARAAAFLVSGAAKRPALEAIAARDPGCPAARLRPAGGLAWLVDADAAPRRGALPDAPPAGPRRAPSPDERARTPLD